MNKIDKNLNKRIIALAYIVVILATFAMVMQFIIFYQIGVANPSQVFVIAILKEMEKPFSYEGKEIKTSVSIGAAVVDGNEDTDLAPLRMADYALFNAKEEGRNKVSVFNSEMAAEIKRRQNLEKGLSDAISGDMLTLKYQPFVSQDGSSISGVEALVRWDHAEEGEVFPDEFIPVAQERGLIEKIGEFILERACSEIKPLDDIRLAVNINPSQFTQKGFVKQIVLDDFGTSYSSMFFLREFKLDRIKLDRNFVNSMQNEKDGHKIIDNMIGLGSTFSDRLTVEGIETEKQLQTLQQNDVNDLQGFLFSKPLTLEELEASKMIAELKDRFYKEKLPKNVKPLSINRMAS